MIPALLLSISTLFITTDPPTQMSEKEYIEDIEIWRSKQDDRMRSPTGWLALTGHYWLKEGVNQIGNDEQATVKLPELPSPVSAKIQVTGNKVVLETDSPELKVNDESITSKRLEIDAQKLEADSKDKITIGDRIRIQLVRRNGRFALRVRDAENEAIHRFNGKIWFPIDENARVVGKFNPYEPIKTIPIVNVKGDQTEAEIVGFVDFEWKGKQLRLDAMSEGPDDLFLIFKDKTNGRSTYGAGRFLNTAVPVDGQVTLDFNKTYNPPCAFSPHTLCPIPPKQNHLEVAIEAGEKLPDSK